MPAGKTSKDTAPAGHRQLINRDLLRTISRQAGVYLMKDAEGRILYVGKAVDLRKRLGAYGRIPAGDPSKTGVMLTRVKSIETILTRTEKEALILEASLIKKHKPKYNIVLRDDKNYPYIKVTVNEKWPRLLMTRRQVKDKALYFGPYASASAMWETLNLLNRLFPLRRCKKSTMSDKNRPCLNFQMGRCLAPCCGEVEPSQYHEMVEDTIMVLEGRNTELARSIREKMRQAADGLEFEKAARYRDCLEALSRTLEKQVVVARHSKDQDVFGVCRRAESVGIAVVLVRHGLVSGQHGFRFDTPMGSDMEILAGVLKQYYTDDRPVPQEILLPFAVEGEQLFVEWLSDLRGSQVNLKIPRRGTGAKLIHMAAANAEQLQEEHQKSSCSWDVLAGMLRKTLHLRNIPEHVECLDISNISGKLPVGSLIRFSRGMAEKKSYRRYKITSVKGVDDYGMMAEVLERRLTAGNHPDLLLLDGGKGHLNMALTIITAHNLLEKIDLAAIAKEKKTEGEKVYRPGRKNPFQLQRHSAVLLFLMRLRDEAHRYGITFHRQLRHKEGLASQLDGIPGVGPGRKHSLLHGFGSVKGVAAASEQQIAALSGIGPALAATIYRYFHK